MSGEPGDEAVVECDDIVTAVCKKATEGVCVSLGAIYIHPYTIATYVCVYYMHSHSPPALTG